MKISKGFRHHKADWPGKAQWMFIFDIDDGYYIWIQKPLRYNLIIVAKYGKDLA